MFDSTELLLYAAARTQHVEECIAPALSEGRTVISDRFSDSTTAYQGYGRGLDLGLIDILNRIATNGIVPDLTIVLDVPVKIGLGRLRSRDRMETETLEFHHRVREGYFAIAKEEPSRVKVISSWRSPQQVHDEIRWLVNRHIK